MHHTIQKKVAWANLAAAADPKSGFSFFFLAMLRALCILPPWAVPLPPWRRVPLIGLSPSSCSPRPSALSPEISASNHHAFTLGSPPWGGRASKNRLRARGGNLLFFIFLAMVWHTIAKKIKSGLRQIGCGADPNQLITDRSP